MKLLLLLVGFLFVGCVSNRVFINKEYKKYNLRGINLTVCCINDFAINYEGSMDEEFGKNDKNTRMKQFVLKSAANTIRVHSNFKTVKIDTSSFKDAEFENIRPHWFNDFDTFTVRIPRNLNDNEEFTLIYQDCFVGSQAKVKVLMINLVPVGAIPHKPLIISGRFVFWDNKNKKPVAYGIARGSSDLGPAVTIDNWKDATRDFGKSTISKTPFLK